MSKKSFLDYLRWRQTPKPSLSASAQIGLWGEGVARDYLRQNGYRILGQNIKIKRDELDIIARQGEHLVFVEVKTRKDASFARPGLSIDARERHALNRVAAAWLRKVNYPDLYYRFDLIEVIGEPHQGTPEVKHTENFMPFERRFFFPV